MNFSQKQLKEALKNIRMTTDERRAIRSALERHMTEYTKPIKSPFVQHAHRFILRPMQAMAIMLVVLISSGTGLSYAANEALPGDPLYGFKVSITEGIPTMIMNDGARASYEVTLASKRLQETAQLALTGRLDKEAEEAITKQLIKHTTKATSFAKKASDTNPQARVTVASDITSELSAHSQVLAEIKEIKKINGELTAILKTAEASIATATKDEQDALIELAKENPATTKERLTEQQKEVANKLATLENLINTPVDELEFKLEKISTDLETIEILSIDEAMEEVTEEKPPVDLEANDDKEPAQEASSTTTLDEEEEEISTEKTVPLEDPSLIENITADIALINKLSLESQDLENEERFAEASAKLQEAIKRANNTLSLIKLKEQYSTVLEKELIPKLQDSLILEVKEEPLLQTLEEELLELESLDLQKTQLELKTNTSLETKTSPRE